MIIEEYVVQSNDNLERIWIKNNMGYSSWQALYQANRDHILQLGRAHMEGIVGPNVTRKPCGLSGSEHNNSRHEIIGGVHYDNVGHPTIYVGDKLFLKVQEEQPPQPEPEEDTPPQPEEPNAREIRKSRWTGVEHQSPGPMLEIYLPRGDPDNPDFVYGASARAGVYTKFLSYNFTEAVDDLEGSFSVTIEYEEDSQGRTVFDQVPIRSVVKIYEGGQKAAFVGIIRRRRLGLTMTSQGARRTLTFSGKSIISCITEYTISLDPRLQGVSDAVHRTIDLTVKLTEKGSPLTIKEFMKITWDHFREVSSIVSEHRNGIATIELEEVINKFIGESLDAFVRVTGKEQTLRYDVAMAFYNAANNVIADVWRNILPDRVYELFSRCDDGEPKIIARQVPYGDPDNGNDDWIKIPIYQISPISLTAYTLDQSDEEVYTAFASYIIGSARERSFYLAVNQTSGDTIVEYSDKCKIYGFRPLEIAFNGYDRQGNMGNANIEKLTEAVSTLNKRAAYWYSRLDEMYSGTITICTDFNEPETNPRVGCRAKFLGGEFYITKADHSWQYEKTPIIVLTVERGMKYDENGKMRDGDAGVIQEVSRRYRELERDNA